ncbi:putative Myosin-XV [Daphnia magna]|uniref:Putative Myosin-XV n=1 Tax=Daphnia magna TaxID=35525 RepID=A0A164TH60_9CRUS|nr:putative Myosin-XV [Daphnia magna]
MCAAKTVGRNSKRQMYRFPEEYILDVTSVLQKNQQIYILIFCRSVSHSNAFDNRTTAAFFNQTAPDCLEDELLLMLDLDNMSTVKSIMCLLPKMALTVRDIRPPQTSPDLPSVSF